MGTTIRAELSNKNPYWIERHRYYELKHFCLQYPIWKKEYAAISEIKSYRSDVIVSSEARFTSDTTSKCAIEKAYYSKRIDMLERMAKLTDPVLGMYILTGVTEGRSYDNLKAVFNIPCCKDAYYDLYRKFFWLLDKERE